MTLMTLSQWKNELGDYYGNILYDMLGDNIHARTDWHYSSFDVLETIISYKGGLANAYELAHLLDLIYGVDICNNDIMEVPQ